MMLDLAPFGRWTLRDEAAQRPSALRYAFQFHWADLANQSGAGSAVERKRSGGVTQKTIILIAYSDYFI